METTPEPSSSNTASLGRRSQPSGIWGLASDLIRLSGKKHSLEDELAATENLRHEVQELRAPFREYLKNLISQGDQAFSAADTAKPAQLAEQRRQIDALTAQFRQVTAGMLPLSKVNVLLGVYETTVRNWRESLRDESHEELRQLLDYRESIEAQRLHLERNVSSTSAAQLQPKVRMRCTSSGIEATVRFPAQIEKTAEIDDHMMRELFSSADRSQSCE